MFLRLATSPRSSWTPQIETMALDDLHRKNIEGLYDFLNPPPPPPSPYGRNGDKRGFSPRHTESPPLRNIAPISIVPLNTPPPSGTLSGQRARNNNTIFFNSPPPSEVPMQHRTIFPDSGSPRPLQMAIWIVPSDVSMITGVTDGDAPLLPAKEKVVLSVRTSKRQLKRDRGPTKMGWRSRQRIHVGSFQLSRIKRPIEVYGVLQRV